MAERAPDKEVIPLCPSHHRTGAGAPSAHLQPVDFFRKYGSDDRLTKLTRIGVQRMLDSTIGKRA